MTTQTAAKTEAKAKPFDPKEFDAAKKAFVPGSMPALQGWRIMVDRATTAGFSVIVKDGDIPNAELKEPKAAAKASAAKAPSEPKAQDTKPAASGAKDKPSDG